MNILLFGNDCFPLQRWGGHTPIDLIDLKEENQTSMSIYSLNVHEASVYDLNCGP